MIFTQPEQDFPNVYDPQQLNRYSFERNNPYGHTDPDGKNPILIGAGIGAVVGVGFYGLEVFNGDLAFSWRGLGSYALGGAITGSVGVISIGLGLATFVAGGISSAASQIITNYGVGRPIGENLDQAFALGVATVGFGEFLPGTRGLKNIKHFSSYFTTKSGSQFVTNIIISEGFSTSISTGNNPLSSIYNSFNSYQINQANQINPSRPSQVQACELICRDTQTSNGNSGSNIKETITNNSARKGETIKGGGICGDNASCG